MEDTMTSHSTHIHSSEMEGSMSSTVSEHSGHDMVASGDMADMDAFCMGDGRVMLNGWQFAGKASNACVLWLFEGAGVTSEGKYAGAIIGTFVLAFANEMLRYNRDKLAKDGFGFSRGLTQGSGMKKDLVLTFAFALQMFVAYSLMLLVMLYEYVFLIAILSGLATGHLVSLKLAKSNGAQGKTLPTKTSYGTPCCDPSTTAA